MVGSEISSNPVGKTDCHREEISNFCMEMSVIMERIVWSEGKKIVCPTMPAFIKTNSSWLAEEWKGQLMGFQNERYYSAGENWGFVIPLYGVS